MHALAGALFLAVTMGSLHAAVPAAERTTLDALYAQTNGAAWRSHIGWEGAAGTECSWQGITCDVAETHVVGISLSSNNLAGTLPAVSTLSALQTFAVDNNHLNGGIPSLSGLSALQSFNAEGNALTGNAPDLSSLSSLREFLVANNQLTGAAPIPPAPNHLLVAASSLCPNFLGPASTPESATDLIWDNATDDFPWSKSCTAAPVVLSAVSVPALGAASLALLFTALLLTASLLLRGRTP
jgi:hypothetical protein